jgi:hypothetical protein
MRSGKIWLVALTVAAAAPAVAQETTMGWQEAVAQLASERTRAEACVALLKRNAAGDAEVLAQGDWTYTEAKADMDGVIAGLVVALAEDDDPVSLDVLNRQLERAVALRGQFCAEAVALAPPTTGTKSLGLDVLAKTMGSLIDAAKEIYLQHREEDVLARKTIQTQVESTRWRPFGEIAAPPT